MIFIPVWSDAEDLGRLLTKEESYWVVQVFVGVWKVRFTPVCASLLAVKIVS